MALASSRRKTPIVALGVKEEGEVGAGGRALRREEEEGLEGLEGQEKGWARTVGCTRLGLGLRAVLRIQERRIRPRLFMRYACIAKHLD